MVAVGLSLSKGGAQRQGIGPIMLLVSLLAGLAGGVLGICHAGSDFSSLNDVHGLFLAFFVIAPAFIGGVGRVDLPRALNAQQAQFHWIDWLAFGLILLAIMCACVAAAGWTRGVALSVLIVSCGLALLAINTIIFILEMRNERSGALSIFVWSQLLTAIAVIISTPVCVVYAITMFLSETTTFANLIGLSRLPLEAIAASATIGLVGAALKPKRARATPVVAAMLAIICVFLPLVWFKALTIGVSVTEREWAFCLALPTSVIVGTYVVTLWRASRRFDISLIWSFGGLLMLAAGWFSPWLGSRDVAAHTWISFAAISALFGVFYAWQEGQRCRATWAYVCITHFCAYFAGVIMSLAPWRSVQATGHVMMAVCLGFVILLFTRYFANRDDHVPEMPLVSVDR